MESTYGERKHVTHSLTAHLRMVLVRFNSGFTWAKDLGNEQLTAYTPGAPENAYNWVRERGPTQAQAGRRWIGFFIYELPIGPGKRFGSGMSGVARHVLGG